jgi:RNA polymerase sigma-70 factor (ECF subfamily)
LSVDDEWSRLRRGDPGAFEAVLARHQNRLYRYLLRLLRDEAAADDLFQQTWLKVMTRLHRYDTNRSFEAWLLAIARNLVIDHLRRHSKELLEARLPSGDSAAARVPASQPGALESLLTRERRELLLDKLSELPVIYREALSLRFEEEMTFEEMAEVLGTPLSTVKSRVQRGLQALRGKLRQAPLEAGDR